MSLSKLQKANLTCQVLTASKFRLGARAGLYRSRLRFQRQGLEAGTSKADNLLFSANVDATWALRAFDASLITILEVFDLAGSEALAQLDNGSLERLSQTQMSRELVMSQPCSYQHIPCIMYDTWPEALLQDMDESMLSLSEDDSGSYVCLSQLLPPPPAFVCIRCEFCT